MQKQLLYQFLLETHNEAGKLFSFLYKNKKRSKRTNDTSMQVIPAAVLKVLGIIASAMRSLFFGIQKGLNAR